jgi:hypothetical protein
MECARDIGNAASLRCRLCGPTHNSRLWRTMVAVCQASGCVGGRRDLFGKVGRVQRTRRQAAPSVTAFSSASSRSICVGGSRSAGRSIANNGTCTEYADLYPLPSHPHYTPSPLPFSVTRQVPTSGLVLDRTQILPLTRPRRLLPCSSLTLDYPLSTRTPFVTFVSTSLTRRFRFSLPSHVIAPAAEFRSIRHFNRTLRCRCLRVRTRHFSLAKTVASVETDNSSHHALIK